MSVGDIITSYTYDANNRLLKTVKTQNNIDEITNYIYDNNGNQIAWYKGSISPSGGTSSLALTDETDGTDYGYYTYDAFNRLSTYTNGVTNASYTYGADNLRKSKTVDGVTTNYTWNGSNMVLEEKGTQTNRYYYGADGIAFAKFNGTTNYYQKNAHGDITALTNASGAITKNYQFDAFGNELTNNANDINPFRYAGEYQDNETGLIYLRNRYYDSNNGRFITEDPIKDGLNWYVYANNNPIMFVDPFGLFYDEVAEALQTIIDNKARMTALGTPKHEYATAYSNILVAKKQIADDVIYIEDWGGVRDILSPLIEGDNNSLDSIKKMKDGVIAAEKKSNRDDAITDVVFTTVLTVGTAVIIKTGAALIVGGKTKYPGNDPSVSPGKGWEWRGSGSPAEGKGSWYNPKTGESLHPDLNHPAPIKPHWDYKAGRNGPEYRWYPDGTMELK